MTKCNQILDRVVLVKIQANIYGARKKLRKEDLVLADGSELPPEDLASLGSKRLLDPDQLADFNRLKKAAERHCLRVGTRFMGGFVVPVEHADAIVSELEKVAQEFAVNKAKFLAGYDDAVRDWIKKHPSFAGIIEKAIDLWRTWPRSWVSTSWWSPSDNRKPPAERCGTAGTANRFDRRPVVSRSGQRRRVIAGTILDRKRSGHPECVAAD